MGTPAGRRGFTLIEMVVLIIIMAIISGVVVPAYARFHARARFIHTVEETAGLFRWARETAIAQGGAVVVRYDPQMGAFAAMAEAPAEEMDLPAALQETEEPLYAGPATSGYELPEGVRVAGFEPFGQAAPSGARDAALEMRFSADGSADGGMLALESEDGYAALIEVVPTTGRTVVREPEAGP